MHFNPTLEKFLPNIHEKPSLSMILAKKNFSQRALRRKVCKNIKSIKRLIILFSEKRDTLKLFAL
ncbi:hypothetical protein CIK91_07260 [Segatella bryantii]|uniref:Uncharacterized protein n=1 Tax=Segatella bryantii TaxID=77095 RepID=A0ABX4EH80_SEGBR|nr:hypothetical protein CIK91_07260 [Segatella bryantii]